MKTGALIEISKIQTFYLSETVSKYKNGFDLKSGEMALAVLNPSQFFILRWIFSYKYGSF
jgi:hypothetical protein